MSDEIDLSVYRLPDPPHPGYIWRHYLAPWQKLTGWRGHKGGSPVDPMPDRVADLSAPGLLHKRCQAGHWEGDLMLVCQVWSGSSCHP